MVADAGEPKRRWCVPPALYGEPGERLDDLVVLEENPTAVGAILWEALRDVTLWAESDSAERTQLFAPGAAARRGRAIASAPVSPELGMALQPLTALLSDPEQAPEPVIASACAAISEWAAGQAARHTALAFAQAAARVQPTDARVALHAGDLARELRRFERAASWYRRTLGLARRAKDWASYTESLLRLGEIALVQENHRAAKGYATKVSRAARRHGIHGHTGDGLRILYRLAERANDEPAMLHLSRRIVRAYGRDNPRLIPFLLELARAWLNRSAAERAGTILTSLTDRLTDPADVAIRDALMARAAAAQGKRRVFDESWSRAWSFLRTRDDDPLTNMILRDLSAAAGAVGDWERMGQAIDRAGGNRDRRFDDAP